jgi:hypothetical protein
MTRLGSHSESDNCLGFMSGTAVSKLVRGRCPESFWDSYIEKITRLVEF